MKHYSEAAVERMMKVQEVIMRALAKKIRWYEAAEILGISIRQMRRRKDVGIARDMTACSIVVWVSLHRSGCR